MGTMVQEEDWYAGVWVAGWRGLGEQWIWAKRGLGKLGKRNAGMGSADALVQAGDQLARKKAPLQKKLLGVLADNGLNMSQQGVVAEEGQLRIIL